MAGGRQAIDMTGQQFGLLTVIRRAGSIVTDRGTVSTWVCSCACGGTAVVRRSNLVRGMTRSCGCSRASRGGKLTTSDVIEIRRRSLAGESQRSIGRHFGVSHTSVHLVVNGMAWKHVTCPEATPAAEHG